MKRFKLPQCSILLFCVGLFFGSCSNFQKTESYNDEPGDIVLSISLQEIGKLSKRNRTTEIVLSHLLISLTAENELPINDTISISAASKSALSADYPGLSANKEWTVSVKSIDSRGMVIHEGSKKVTLRPREIAQVDISLETRYSMLITNIFPMKKEITRCQILVDDVVKIDTTLPLGHAIDTLRSSYDYVAVTNSNTTRRISFLLYGSWFDKQELFYRFDTSLVILPGKNIGCDMTLKWVGPYDPQATFLKLNLSLGLAGEVTFNVHFPNDNPSTSKFENTDNTIAHWTFDDMQDGTINDVCGGGLKAVLNGDGELVETAYGKGIRLNGMNSFLQVDQWNGLTNYKKVVIEVLCKYINDGTSGEAGPFEIFTDHHWHPTKGMVLRYLNGGPEFAVGTTNSWCYATGNGSFSANEWHCLKATLDNDAHVISVQIDDREPVSTSFQGEFVASTLGFTRMGANSVDPPSRFFNGIIDEVRIQAWESSGSLTDYAPYLKAHWSFDAINDNYLADLSDNGNHGLCHEVTCANGSYYFPGTSNYISIPDNGSLEDFSSFTIIAKVKPQTINPLSGVAQNVLRKENCYAFGIGADGRIGFWLHNGSWMGSWTLSAMQIDTNWHTIAGRWDGKTMNIFIDGQKDPNSFEFPYTLDNTSNDVVIGYLYEGSYEQFNGFMNDLKVYSFALPDEILQTNMSM